MKLLVPVMGHWSQRPGFYSIFQKVGSAAISPP
jgi:hypothetical protein